MAKLADKIISITVVFMIIIFAAATTISRITGDSCISIFKSQITRLKHFGLNIQKAIIDKTQ